MDLAGFKKFFAKNYLILLLLVLLAGGLLRFAFLGTASIRGDEGYSIFAASKESIPAIVNEIKGENHPLLYYSLLHFWLNLGNSEFIIRSLSVIFSILALAAVFFLGKEFFDDKTSLLATFIMAISQFHIRHSQWARSYSLQVLLATLSLYFFIRFLKEKDWKNLSFYVVFTTLALYTHYYLFLVLFAEFVIFLSLWKEHKELWKKYFIAIAVIALLFLPWLPIFKYQISNLSAAYEANIGASNINFSLLGLNQDNILLRLVMIAFHFSIGYIQFNIHSIAFLLVFALTVPLFSTAFLKGALSLKAEKSKMKTLLLFLFIPFIVLGISWLFKLTSPLPYARYLIYVSPVYYLIISKGIFELKTKKFDLRILLVLLIIVFSAFSLQNYYKLDYKNQDWRSAVGFIGENAKPSDVIAFYPAAQIYNFDYYYTGTQKVFSVPAIISLNKNEYTQAVVVKLSNVLNDSNKCSVLELAKENTTGIWLVQLDPNMQDKTEFPIRKCLESKYTLKYEKENTFTEQSGKTLNDLSVAYYKIGGVE